jgi:hypothetical protein
MAEYLKRTGCLLGLLVAMWRTPPGDISILRRQPRAAELAYSKSASRLQNLYLSQWPAESGKG